MFRMVRFRREKEAAYQAAVAKRVAGAQRWLILAAGVLFTLIGIWTAAAPEGGPGLRTASVVLLVATLVFFAMTFTPFLRNRLDVVPVIAALLFGWHGLLSLVLVPTTAELRGAVLFGSLAVLVALLSPTAQTALAAVATTALIAVLGFALVFPMEGVAVNAALCVAFILPAFLLAIGVALAIDYARREGFSFKHELSRRATTDEISGVSNRAHIHQLAQNEFGRARRYKEPLSLVMLEIDEFDSILENSGPIALDTLIQVFAGYCVVVMRHCDSFGRLDRKRFLALLPETPAKGAMVLATRMCRDLGALEVLADGDSLNFTVSIGVAEAHPNDKWGGDLLRRAGQAVDDAIENGRNTVVLSHMPVVATANDPAPMIANEAVNMMMPPAAPDAGPGAPPPPAEPLDPEGAEDPFASFGNGPGDGPQRLAG